MNKQTISEVMKHLAEKSHKAQKKATGKSFGERMAEYKRLTKKEVVVS